MFAVPWGNFTRIQFSYTFVSFGSGIANRFLIYLKQKHAQFHAFLFSLGLYFAILCQNTCYSISGSCRVIPCQTNKNDNMRIPALQFFMYSTSDSNKKSYIDRFHLKRQLFVLDHLESFHFLRPKSQERHEILFPNESFFFHISNLESISFTPVCFRLSRGVAVRA
jgi:hypothetical protein